MATDHCVTKVSQVINSPLPSPDQYFQNKFQATRNGQKLISHCDNYFLSDQMAHFVNHLFSSSIFNILVPPKFLNYPYIVTFNCPAIFSILSFFVHFQFLYILCLEYPITQPYLCNKYLSSRFSTLASFQ